VTITNVGSVPLYISPNGIGITGGETSDFSAALDTCANRINASDPLIVDSGHTCTFEVSFEPSADSIRTSNVVVVDNTLDTQTQLGLKGMGIDAKPA
jgi:hypothetical protein